MTEKLTQEKLDAMTAKELRDWVQRNCIARPKGRPRLEAPTSDSTERVRRHRERQQK